MKKTHAYAPGFENAVQRHEESPDTFEIDSGKERRGLEVGDFVKVCFKPGPESELAGERMWLLVTKVVKVGNRGGMRYLGRLDNNPIDTDVQCGDVFEFSPQHIYQIIKKEE